MALPFFYTATYDPSRPDIILDEDTSRHVVQVLRMKKGEKLNLTDGKGRVLHCEISEEHKRNCQVRVQSQQAIPASPRSVTVAISLVKNSSRFEWFLEKATEIGVNRIIPLLCERTEKERFRHDRMQQICISAMLQSQQGWLPVLSEPVAFSQIEKWKSSGKNFIAHCLENEKQSLHAFPLHSYPDCLIAIGPEGDFTASEIELALKQQFIPVSLGETRLRTETAGLVAATLLVMNR